MRNILIVLIFIAPTLSYAAPQNFKELVDVFIEIINYVIRFVFALSFLIILWGIFKAWILNGGDEKSIEAGKKTIVVGFIVFTLMLGIWGILAILRQTFFS